MGIHALVIYFCFVLIDLINDYKNIYSRNNNVCLGVCEMVFMCIITFKRLFFSIKRGYEDFFVFVGMLFLSDYKFNYFFSMKRGYRSVLEYG